MKLYLTVLFASLLAPLTSSAQTAQSGAINGSVTSTERAFAAGTLNAAREGFISAYGFNATDCDPIQSEWVCSEFDVTAATTLSLAEPAAESLAACTAYGSNQDAAQIAFSAECEWRDRNYCNLLSSGEWACSTEIITDSITNVSPVITSNATCIAYGSTSQAAQDSFSAECPWRDRNFCGLLSTGEWACSTEVIADSINDPTASLNVGEGVCIAYGASLDDAQESFSTECPWRDRNFCDPLSSGEWACSTESIETSNNVFDTPTTTSITTETTTPATTTTATTTATAPTSSANTGLKIEAESVAYNSAVWSPSEGGLVYTGANRYLLTSRNDDANLVFDFTIPTAGSYRFTMRSRAGNGNDPSEPPNDVWIKVAGDEWLKVFMTRDGQWHIDAIGERNGTHSRDLNTYDFGIGTQQIIVSGRSQGHILDWVALEPQGFTVTESTTTTATTSTPATTSTVAGTGVMNTSYQPGDLVIIAHDSGPDTDDMQAIVANRMIMDAYPAVNYLLVGATQGHAWTTPTAGSEAHTESLFPDWINAKASTSGTTSFDGTSVITVADRIEQTLGNGGTVHIAEGGPSDFTAEVLRLLQSRGVSATNLKRIRVVQHSAGTTAWNEQQTSSTNIALVKTASTWVPIANGNVGGNATADFQEPASSSMCQRFMSSASGTQYASQWAWAYSTIDDARKCDQSDSVELLYILNETSTKTFDQFSSRYM